MKIRVIVTFLSLAVLNSYSATLPQDKYKIRTVNLAATTVPQSGARIVGGQDTTIEEWPFMVQVLLFSSPSCGGSIITERHVLSAAHCFVDPDTLEDYPAQWFSVRAGSTTMYIGGIQIAVAAFVTHETYNRVTIRDDDIAVLLLEQSLTLGDTVAVAALPELGGTVPDEAPVTYLGWGFTTPGVWSISTVLQKVDVYKVNNDVCRDRYSELEMELREAGVIVSYPVTDTMICAGLLDEGGKDACQGDSGGPLVYNGVVVGVIAWGHTCAHPQGMGVNQRVANYTLWIDDAINRLAVEDSSEVAESEEEVAVNSTTPAEGEGADEDTGGDGDDEDPEESNVTDGGAINSFSRILLLVSFISFVSSTF